MAATFKRQASAPPYVTDLALIALGGVALALWLVQVFNLFDLFRQTWPIWIFAALLVLVWTLLCNVPRKRIALVLCVSVLLPGAGSIWTGVQPAYSFMVPAGQHVSFASHNLWGRNRAHDLTIDVLREINADILALQEAGARTRPIHEALGSDYPYEAGCERAPVRLYSRFPIIDSGCMRDLLDANRSHGEPIWRWDFPASNWARIELPNGERFVMVNVHFTWPNPLSSQDQERINFAEIVQLFDQETIVILGDFNAAAPSAALARFDRDLEPSRRTHSIATWPSQGRWMNDDGNAVPVPTMFAGIDHIYAGERWMNVDIEAGPNTGSDHRPIIGQMILTESAG